MAKGAAPGVSLDGTKLKAIMKKKGLSSEKLARMMGNEKNTINTWIREKYRPREEKFMQLCAILDCNDEDLLKDPKPEPKEEPVQIVRDEIGKPHMSASIPREAMAKAMSQQSTFSHIDVMLNLLQDSIEVNSGIMKQIQRDNEELRGMLKTTIDILRARESVDVMQLGAASMEMLDNQYRYFKKQATQKANEIIASHKEYKSTSEVFSKAYKLLRAEYGIVWEQESKEFKEANGYPVASTIQLVYWMEANKPQYHNLFLSKLDTLAK